MSFLNYGAQNGVANPALVEDMDVSTGELWAQDLMPLLAWKNLGYLMTLSLSCPHHSKWSPDEYLAHRAVL